MLTLATATTARLTSAAGGRHAGRHAREVIRVACEPESHQICVVNDRGELLEVFGEHGELPGQFDRPSDVIVVAPRFDGEDGAAGRLDLVVVADRGNHRLQVFEPEGQLVALIGGAGAERDTVATGARDGWPFFRLSGHPPIADPASLRWEDPWLVVIDGEGRETRLDLAVALLPTFDEWLAAASRPMLAAAHHHFRHKARRRALAAPLATIETALGQALLESGDVGAVSRLWALGWPQVDAAVRDAQAAARDRAAMRAAFRLGGADSVSRVRTAIRLSLGVFATWPDHTSRGGRATREAS
jgi:hypothetical protein